MAEFDNPAVFYLHRGKVTNLPKAERLIAGKKVKEAYFQADMGDFLVAVSMALFIKDGAVLNPGWQWPNVARFLKGGSS